MKSDNKNQLYQAAVIFSLIFSLLGFSYNVWRMEQTEQNSNIRTSCFEILLQLASLEQLIYNAHYDKKGTDASPRKGWVKVGLIKDLSILTTELLETEAVALHAVWGREWNTMVADTESVEKIVVAIDSVRSEIKRTLVALE